MNLNTTDKQEQPIQDSSELIEKGGCKKCREEVLELIRLCNLSHMPEKLTEFIEQNVSTQEAREILMELLAERTKKTEILSTIPQNSPEDLMMEAAKARQTA